jgi:hypothetical protein
MHRDARPAIIFRRHHKKWRFFMATYYKKIKGKNYDKKLLNRADSSVKGKGDGRISLKDAKSILVIVKDSNEYSGTEKNTMKFIRDNYDFTPEADRWFRTEIRKWAAKKSAPAKADGKPKRPAAALKKKVKKAPVTTKFPEEQFIPGETASLPKREEAKKPGGKGFAKFIKVLAIILALLGIGFLLTPRGKEWLKSIMPSAVEPEKPLTINEGKTPALQQPKAQPDPEQKAPDVVQPKPAPKTDESGEYYTVQVKDDLVSISEKVLGNYTRWIELYNANRDIIKNPTIIFPGQKLKLPAAKKN